MVVPPRAEDWLPEPAVSVVIPTYNHGRFLERSLTSVFAQTFPDYEVIVVNDGSTDDTNDQMKMYRGRIKYYCGDNRGLGCARNIGLNLAVGRYVQFLDADDSIAPEKFARQVPLLEADESVALVYSDYANVDVGSDVCDAPSLPLAREESALQRLIRENFIPVHSPLVRRAVFFKEGNFDESRIAQEDWDLWLRLASRGYRFQYVPGVLCFYHRDGSQMVSNPELMYQRGLHLLNKCLSDPQFNRLGDRLVREFRAYQHFALARRSYNQRQWSRARVHLWNAVLARERSLQLRLWSLMLKTFVHQLFE